MMAELGYFLSQFNYSYVSTDGTKIGKYAVDATYLASAGYIKPDAVTQYGNKALSNNNSWTGRDNISSQDDFFNSPNIQDTIQLNEFTASYAALVASGGIKPDDDVCTAAGMMFVMHEYRTADLAKQWRNGGDSAVATSKLMDSALVGSIMYTQGRYAVDVLASGGAVASSAQSVGLNGPNTTGIDPDLVFTFQSSGTGTRERFDQLNGTFKDSILKMAQDYKAKTGAKIAITSAYRSEADQEAVYQRWLDAGGGPNNPTAGGITTPARPASKGGTATAHNSGVAIDSGQMALVARTVDLPSYGLRWGGTFNKPDAVHIQLANFTQ